MFFIISEGHGCEVILDECIHGDCGVCFSDYVFHNHNYVVDGSCFFVSNFLCGGRGCGVECLTRWRWFHTHGGRVKSFLMKTILSLPQCNILFCWIYIFSYVIFSVLWACFFCGLGLFCWGC